MQSHTQNIKIRRVEGPQMAPGWVSLDLSCFGLFPWFTCTLCAWPPTQQCSHTYTPSSVALRKGKYSGLVLTLIFDHNSEYVGFISNTHTHTPHPGLVVCIWKMCAHTRIMLGVGDTVLINIACFCLLENCFPRFNLVFGKFLNYIPTYK